MSDSTGSIEEVIELFNDHQDEIELLQKSVINFFEQRKFKDVVHSIRHRMKDKEHLAEKINRKNQEDSEKPIEKQKGPINVDNLFERVTDLAGVRVLHLHLNQFRDIHQAIINSDFILVENPKAYTWDPDSIKFFEDVDNKIDVERKDSFYTSIHYLVKINSKSKFVCEIQVRTLLEEVWGEVDHTMNYPTPIEDKICRENIKVLARLVGAGGHLADTIMKHYGD